MTPRRRLLWLPLLALAPVLTPATGGAVVRPSGLYALDPCFKNGTCPSLPDYVHGVYVRVNWDKVQPTETGPYNWTAIDATVARARAAGRRVTIGVAPGTSSPHWLYTSGAGAFRMTWNFSWGPPRCTKVPFPLPWDPVFQRAWAAFVAALGERYDADPTVVGVKVAGIDAETMENVVPTKTIYGCGAAPDDPIAQWLAVGYTPQRLRAAWAGILAAFSRAFAATSLVLMTGPWPMPGIDAAGHRTAQPDYNLTRTLQEDFTATLGPARCAIQNNGLSVWWHWAPSHVPPDTVVGAQALWSITGDKTCRMMSHHTPCSEVYVLNRTLENAVAYHDAYVEMYLVDIMNPKPAFQALLAAFAARFPPPPLVL